MFKLPVAMDETVGIRTVLALVAVTIVLVMAVGLVVGKIFFWSNSSTGASQPARDFQTASAQVRADPQQADAYINLGWSYVELKEWNKAIAQYQHALKLSPGNEVAQYNIALVKIQQGQLSEARSDLELLRKQKPDYWDARITLSYVYLKMGKAQLAVQELEAINSANPGQVNVLYQLGQAYQAAGETAKAKATYSLALRYNPEDKTVQKALAATN